MAGEYRATTMDTGLYIAASGMLAEQVRQDQLASDLANGSTPGYKAETAVQSAFNYLLLSNTANGQVIGTIAADTGVEKMVTDLTPQALHDTGQPLDFGIAGLGFFAVRTPQGVRYTRDGQFAANAKGQLVDGQGNLVLSQGGAPILLGPGGTVPATALGIFNVGNPVRQGNDLFSGGAAGKGTGIVLQGKLEESGVDPIHTMVDMIASLRAYEAGQKAIQSIDQTLQESSQSVGNLG